MFLRCKFGPTINLRYALIIFDSKYFNKLINTIENYIKQRYWQIEIVNSKKKQIIALVALKFIDCLFCIRHHIKHFIYNGPLKT